MSFKYLKPEEILRLHFQVIEDYGGTHGIIEENRLKSLAIAPSQIVFGREQYSTIYEKAAVYMRNIIGDHLFIDGNKRTAVTVTGIFLSRNGYKLNAEPKSLEDFTVKIATEGLSIEEIALWIEENTK